MSRKIDKLDAKQIARFPEFVKKWVDIGLCTKPIDKIEAEAAIKRAYKQAKLKMPKIIYVGSPAEFPKYIGKHGDSLIHKLRTNVWLGARDVIKYIISDEVKKQTQTEIWTKIADQAGQSAFRELQEYLQDALKGQFVDIGYGQQDANWLGFFDFFMDACNLTEELKIAEPLIALAKSAGWFLPYDDVCIIADRPNEIYRDEAGRCHCETGPAMGFRSGIGIYVWHGVRLGKDHEYIVTDPKKITPAAIDKEGNQEIKRILLEKYTIARYISDSKAKLVHEDVDQIGQIRQLYTKEVPGTNQLLTVVKVMNSSLEPDGTRKAYFLECHPELRPMMRAKGGDLKLGEPQKLTCHNAVASTFGLLGEEYAPDIET